MDKTPEQLTQPLNYEMFDPEKGPQGGSQAPIGYTGAKPEFGFDLVPPVGTVPQPLIMQAMTRALLKKLHETGAVYEGELHEGQRHGKGKLTYMDGTYYEGDFVEGKK